MSVEKNYDAKQNNSRAEFARTIKVTLNICYMVVKFAPVFWWSRGLLTDIAQLTVKFLNLKLISRFLTFPQFILTILLAIVKPSYW